MILDEIVLHNVGVYAGRQHIVLTPPHPHRPVILFGGLNGGGKTTLLDALQLVLYGPRARCSNRGTLSYEEFLRRTTSRGKEHEGSAVELRFRIPGEAGDLGYRIHRSWSMKGSVPREVFEVWIDGKLDVVAAETWAEHVEEFMPLHLAPLFLFDGEKIESLADPDQASEVLSSAVSALLGIGLLDRLQGDLQVLERTKRLAATTEVDRRPVEEAQVAAERAQAALDLAMQRCGAAQNEVDQAAKALAAREQDLNANGADLASQRADLERSAASLRSAVDEHFEKLRDLASSAMPLAIVTDLLQEVREQAAAEQQAESAVELVNVLNERDARVLELIGSAKTKKAVERFFDEERLKVQALAETPRYLGLDGGPSRVDLIVGSEVIPAADRAREELADLDKAQRRLVTAERRLQAAPSEQDLAGLIVARDEARDNLTAARARLQVLEEQRLAAAADRDRSRERFERRLEEANLAEVGGLDTSRLLRHSERVRGTLERFRATLLERNVQRIEAAILDSFRRLHRKTGMVQDLRIEPSTFRLTVFGPTGEPLSTERLSAGERQLLAVAMLWGLARVAGRRLPMVIDTPLGRLDSQHRRHLVERYFPAASHQLLLLSTDEEIDEELYETLAPHVGRAYRLDYDQSSHLTEVHRGYFWTETEHVA